MIFAKRHIPGKGHPNPTTTAVWKNLMPLWPKLMMVSLSVVIVVWTFSGGDDDVSTTARTLLETAAREFSGGEEPGMAGVLEKNGFKFARSPTEFILEAAYARSGQNNSNPLYDEHELRMIQRSLNTMRGFMNQGLWSGSHASMHFLGTGSCLIKLKQPADQVSVGSMHGVYLQKWRPHAYRGKEDECDKRYRLRTVLGSELETALWLDTGLYGNGPWSTCVSTYIKIWERNITKPDSKTIQFLEDLPLYMLLCDEIEEAMGGEAILSGHWKRRDTKFYNDIVTLANYMHEPRLVNWMEDARQMSHAMMHKEQAYIHFKELTPPSFDELFNTAKLNPEADSVDLDRWSTMVDVTRHEQKLIAPFFKPNLLPGTRNGIHTSRDLCDKVESGEISLDQYMDQFFLLKQELLKCETTDTRFQKTIPLPMDIPNWANPGLFEVSPKAISENS